MPMLHLICGLPCAGKTTLAKQLERDVPALRLCPTSGWPASSVMVTIRQNEELLRRLGLRNSAELPGHLPGQRGPTRLVDELV